MTSVANRAVQSKWNSAHKFADNPPRKNYAKPGPKPGSRRQVLYVPPWNPQTDKIQFYTSPNLDMGRYPDEWRWPIAHLLDLIHWHRFSKWKWHDPDRWVQLKARYLNRAIPQHLLPLIRQRLIDDAVIECDGVTRIGTKCLGYRLAEEYRKTELVTCTDEDFCRKVHRIRHEDQRSLQPIHRLLKADVENVGIDMERASAIIKTLKPKKKKRKLPYSTAEYRANLEENCRMIANGGHNWRDVDRYGRVHTLPGNLKRELRCCLFAKTERGNDPIILIDLPNSQPLIAGIVAMRYYGKSRMGKHRLAIMKFQENSKHHYRAANRLIGENRLLGETENHGNMMISYPPIHHLSKYAGYGYTNLDDIAGAGEGNLSITGNWYYLSPYGSKELGSSDSVTLPQDLMKWLDLCREGRIYGFLMSSKERERAKTDPTFASRFKVQVLTVMYKSTKICNFWPKKLDRRFKRLFPSMYSFLWSIKRKDHRRAAWIMQNVEACIFIQRICRRIKRDRPSTFLLPIHDCLGTTPESVEYVQSVITDEFRKLGAEPKRLKTESFA